MRSETEFDYFCEWARASKRKHQLHPAVEKELSALLRTSFPDTMPVTEIGGVKGGRNDLVQFFQNGRRAVFELFFSPSQVAQDLRLLEQAEATWRFAILMDEQLVPELAKTYFRKRPDAFPHLWLSQVMMPSKRSECIDWLKRELSKEPVTPVDSKSRQIVNINGDGNVVAGRDVFVAPKIVKRPKIVREEGDASERQIKAIADAIRKLDETDKFAGKEANYGGWMAHLKNRYKVESYRKLTVAEADDAISWLQQELGRKLPTLRRTNNEEWRRRVMTGIWAAAGEIGLSHEQVHAFAREYLQLASPVNSLKELGERNLEKLRDRLRRMKNTASS